jgi:predicted RNase H-like HicB family nuclease
VRTSRKSKSSFRARKRLDRPFDPAVLDRARRIVAQYRLVLEPDNDLGYVGTSLELPTVFADGNTPDSCVEATREALAVAVATMIEMGDPPPTSRVRRSLQINVRLTPDEKRTLEEAASLRGFRGISEFVRSVAIERAAKG